MTAPLTRVCCSGCLGDGYTVAHPGDWAEAFASCDACSGFGEIEVCPICQTTPDENDECGCTVHTAKLCEICELTVRATELCAYSVCRSCQDAMAEALVREGNPEVLWALEHTDWLPAA